MIGRTNVGGGGNTFAFIVVTYPADSYCTCSDGTRTINAKGRTGSFVFDIPYAATWTVECHNDTTEESDEVDVEILTKGQRVAVELMYTLELYNLGTELKTWGLQDSKATKQTDHIELTTSNSNTLAYYSTQEKLLFPSSLKTLHATFEVVSHSYSSSLKTFAALFVRTTIPTMSNVDSNDEDLVSSIGNTWTNGNTYSIELDVSSFAGLERYVLFGIRYNASIKLKHVWLTR